jgi:hypothetical protein
MTRTPVVLLVFNRPDLTARVLEAVAQARPKTIFVVADGPREGRRADAAGCRATRALFDRLDWRCEVVKDYSATNLGVDSRVPLGLARVFEQVDDAIVLEDDCVPHPSFFRFCGELLDRYRDDTRVMHIAGSTYRPHPIATPYSYYFSQFNGCWGWATWRRAWRYFDPALPLWGELRDTSWLTDLVEEPAAVQYWAREFDDAWTHKGRASAWDHQWTFACWANSGLSIAPRDNLVTNIGCGPGATHMVGSGDPRGNLPVHEVAFPLRHPPSVLQLRSADRECVREVVLPSLWRPSRTRVLASRLAPRFARAGVRRLIDAVRPLAAGAHTA